MHSILITHGNRFFGPNPGHTEEGFGQIRKVAQQLPATLPLFVVGTSRRFNEIYETVVQVKPELAAIPRIWSPFCGSADGLEADRKTVILSDSTLLDLDTEYDGLFEHCFLPWVFIRQYPEGTVFCAGGELLIALGWKSINEYGRPYLGALKILPGASRQE